MDGAVLGGDDSTRPAIGARADFLSGQSLASTGCPIIIIIIIKIIIIIIIIIIINETHLTKYTRERQRNIITDDVAARSYVGRCDCVNGACGSTASHDGA